MASKSWGAQLGSPPKVMGASYLAAVGALTIGYTDAMPSPRRYVAITLAWWVMGLVSNFGEVPARLMSQLSLLVLLGLFIGRAGQKGAALRLSEFALRVSSSFAATPSGAPPASSSSSTSPRGGNV